MSKSREPGKKLAEVVSLADRRTNGVPPLLSIVPAPACNCAFRMNAATRAVVCIRCGKVWDAFNALVYIAEDHVRFEHNRAELRRDADRLHGEVTGLLRTLANLRARAKRARMRNGEGA